MLQRFGKYIYGYDTHDIIEIIDHYQQYNLYNKIKGSYWQKWENNSGSFVGVEQGEENCIKYDQKTVKKTICYIFNKEYLDSLFIVLKKTTIFKPDLFYW